MKKVLSFVLVLALVLSSFSMAFATEAEPAGLTDIAGNTNEEAIQVASDLGIVTGNPDGTFQPEKDVNRAEFAAMITRALGVPSTALAGYTSTKFKDTVGYGWAVPYLAFCESKGIMLGDGAGNVMPGRTINTNEAMTMVLRAIGYTSNSSVLVGAWPSNYVTLAQDLDIYDDVAAVLSVDKANAAQVIYNALTILKVQVAADGTTTTLATSMLTAGLDCSQRDAVVDYDDDSIINLIPYVGAYGTKYLNDDGEIVAFKASSDFLTGEFNSDGEFEANDVTYKFDSMITLGSTTTSSISNAKMTSGTSIPNNDTTNTYTLAVDLTGKTINEVYTMATWTVTGHEYADADVQAEIKDNELAGFAFAEDDDEAIDLAKFALVGVDSLSKIAEDNVVYVYTYDNVGSNDIVKVEVGTAIIEGVVSGQNSDGDFKIDGTYYVNASDKENNLATSNVGDTVKVWLNADDEVYDFEVTDSTADNYAVVTKAPATSGFDNIVKLIDAENNEKTYTIDDDVTTSAIVGQIVKFGLDKDGVIDALDSTPAAVVGTDVCTTVTWGCLTVETAKVAKIDSKSYRIDSKVIAWTYEGADAANGTDWELINIADIDDTATTKTANVYFDDSNVIVAIAVSVDDANASDDDIYAVIDEKNVVADADNEKVYQLVGMAAGSALDKNTKDYGTKFNPIVVEDANVRLYKLDIDAEGIINDVSLEAVIGDGITGTALTSGQAVEVYEAGNGYITATDTAVFGVNGVRTVAIADTAVFYEVEFDDGVVDKYTEFKGTVREGYKVWVCETDDDEAGYDVVIVLK